MVPKLKVPIHEAVLHGQSLDVKATVSGYCHTNFDTKGVNIMELSRFPSNIAVKCAASDAYGEVGLMVLIFPNHINQHQGTDTTFLPPISTWLNDNNDKSLYCNITDGGPQKWLNFWVIFAKLWDANM